MRNEKAVQRRWQGAIIACMAAVIGVSCGGNMSQTSHAGATTGSTKDATLSLNKSSISFGNVWVGSTKSNSLTLTNSSASGGPSVTFSQVSTTGAGFHATTTSLPIVLDPGQSSTITITFSPTSAGAVNGTLAILVDGATDPASVALTGTALGTNQLGASPSALSFGTVALGSSLNKAATLTAGNSAITVSSADWSGQGYSVSGISFPVTVAAGQSVTFTVTFAPEAAGSSSGRVSFISNASNSPTTVTFSGTGSQTQSQNPGAAHTVQLTWGASTSSVMGYYAYRSSKSGGPYTKLDEGSPTTGTSYSDSTVQSGQTYYYVVTSVDPDAVESGYSNQVTAVVP